MHIENLDPIALFQEWLEFATLSDVKEPNTATLATANKQGMPSARAILIKDIHDDGISFYTNYNSAKAKDLEENPHAALCMYWLTIPTPRQIRVEGIVKKTTKKESDAYFESRDTLSKLGAWASKQSEALDDYTTLMDAVEKEEEKYKGKSIPRPAFWGGFKLIPHRIEFWENGSGRLHKRVQFTKEKGSWDAVKLYP